MTIVYFIYQSTYRTPPPPKKKKNCWPGPSSNKSCVELALGSSIVIENYKFNSKTTFRPFLLKTRNHSDWIFDNQYCNTLVNYRS